MKNSPADTATVINGTYILCDRRSLNMAPSGKTQVAVLHSAAAQPSVTRGGVSLTQFWASHWFDEEPKGSAVLPALLFAFIRVHSRPHWFFLCSHVEPFGPRMNANERE